MLQNSAGNTPSGGAKMVGAVNLRFSTKITAYLGNSTRYAIATLTGVIGTDRTVIFSITFSDHERGQCWVLRSIRMVVHRPNWAGKGGTCFGSQPCQTTQGAASECSHTFGISTYMFDLERPNSTWKPVETPVAYVVCFWGHPCPQPNGAVPQRSPVFDTLMHVGTVWPVRVLARDSSAV